FWQDVARDLAMGRIYLPRDDRERFSYPEADLRARRFTPACAALLKFEVERTRNLFAAGRGLVGRVPRAFAIDTGLFLRGGLGILDRIEGRGFDVLSARPALSRWTKLRLLAKALAALGVAWLSGPLRGARAPRSARGPAEETAVSWHPEKAP